MKLFGGGHYVNPADKAMPYLDLIPGKAQQYLGPYQQAGRRSLDILQPQYESLISDPNALIERLMEGYRPSSQYNLAKDEISRSMDAAAAAGGELGTVPTQYERGRAVGDLASRDMDNFLSRALGVYGMGMSGESGLNQMGYMASKDLMDQIIANLQSQATLGYHGQEEQNQRNADMWNNLSKMIGGISSLF